MILVLGSVTVRDGMIDNAIKVSQEHVDRSRSEPGCVSHAVYRDCEDLNRLVFVEEWKDDASLRQHFKVPASRAFVAALTAVAIGAPSLKIYEVSRVGP
jgi:quinol monooxygenase YgiN